MKKITVLLVGALLLTLAANISVCAGAGPEVLNPGFESYDNMDSTLANGWSKPVPSSVYSLNTNSAYARSGNNSLSINVPSFTNDAYYGMHATVTGLEADESYSFSGWFYFEDYPIENYEGKTEGERIIKTFRDGNGLEFITTVSELNQWVNVSYTFIATAETMTNIGVTCKLGGSVLYMDDFSVKKGGNLLSTKNPGFEVFNASGIQYTGWNLTGAQVVSYETTDVPTGGYCLKIAGQASRNGMYVNFKGMKLGRTYKFSYKIKADAADSGLFFSQFGWLKGSTEINISLRSYHYPSIVDPNAWKRVVVYVTVPSLSDDAGLADFNTAQLMLRTESGKTGKTVWVDDISVEEAVSNAEFVDSANNYEYTSGTLASGSEVTAEAYCADSGGIIVLLTRYTTDESGIITLIDCVFSPLGKGERYTGTAVMPEGDSCMVKLMLWNGFNSAVPLFRAKVLTSPNINIIQNGDFEILNANGSVKGWNPYQYQSTWTNKTTVAHEAERGNTVRIESDGGNPWINTFVDVVPGATYKVRGLLKTVSVNGSGPAFKTEYYKDVIKNVNVQGQWSGDYYKSTGGNWKEVSGVFTVPITANRMVLFVRLYGAGEVYWDDISCHMVGKPCRMEVNTDVFYYTEWEDGYYSAIINHGAYPDTSTDKVEFILKDGEAVLDTADYFATEREVKHCFKISQLSELGKEYKLTVNYKDRTGKILETYTVPVYRYNRPTRITEDKLFLDNNGDAFFPVMGYHVNKSDLARAQAAGINLVQSQHGYEGTLATSANIPGLIEYMDDAWYNYGIMTAVVLYPGMHPAGAPENIQKTIDCVNAVKDHPGLFMYMVMDEPFAGLSREKAAHVYDLLKTSYKTIRDIDPEHPVYFCAYQPEFYEWSSDCTDVMGIDPYPYSTNTSIVYEWAVKAGKAAEFKKPIINILQAWPYQGYEPTSNDIRQMAYQALFAKNEGIAFFDVSDWYATGENGAPSNLWDRELYDGVTGFTGMEAQDAYKAFITGEYPTLTERCGLNEGNWYKVFVKGDDLYAIIVNYNGKTGNVSIPLTSADGTITVGDFTGVGADISNLPAVSGNGTLNVTVTIPYQAMRYKLTTDTDFSGLMGP